MDPLNQEQLDHYHHRGWVTLAGPFSPAHVASAAAAIGRMCPEADAGSNQRSQASFSPSAAGGPIPQPILDMIQHPWQEAVSKQVRRPPTRPHAGGGWGSNHRCRRPAGPTSLTALAAQVLRSRSIRWTGCSAVVSYPSVHPYHARAHIDEQYLPEHLQASPVPIIHGCSLWLWLSDVTSPDAGPIRVYPGSHLLLADAWARDPSLTELPLHIGMRKYELPQDAVAAMEPPVPILAKAGELTLFNYGTLHSSSAVLRKGRERRLLLLQYGDEDVVRQRQGVKSGEFYAQARATAAQLRPERAFLCDYSPPPRM